MITYLHHTNTVILIDSSVVTESVAVDWSGWVYKVVYVKKISGTLAWEPDLHFDRMDRLVQITEVFLFFVLYGDYNCHVNSLHHPCCPFGCGTIHDPLPDGLLNHLME